MIKFSRHGKSMRKIKIKELELQKQDRKKKGGKRIEKYTCGWSVDVWRHEGQWKGIQYQVIDRKSWNQEDGIFELYIIL